ncbi:MAG TPA: metallophosphoesterase, partial [Thermoanaerobaculia bacterium]
MSSFSWLHLTDLHYGLKGQDCLWPTLREPFLESLGPLHDRCGPWNAVLFTGDLVQSGESAQFASLQAEVLGPLWERLAELGSESAALLAVPGNHDLYRPFDPDDAAVDMLLKADGFETIKGKFWDQPRSGYRRVVHGAFAAYSEWWESAPHRPAGVKTGILPGDFAATIPCGNRKIGIVGLNTTFLQLAGGDYKGRLVWDPLQLHAVCDGGVDVWTKQHDVCLLLTHQGPEWLTPEARAAGETEIAPAGRLAVHLFGHQHETKIAYIRSGGSPNAVRLCQGCSVFGMEKLGEPPTIQRSHGYAAGRIEIGDAEAHLRLWPRIATRKTGPWRFVPDLVNAELVPADEGTAAESVSIRSRASARTRATPALAVPPSPTGPSSAVPVAPHSTLPARRPFFGRKDELDTIARHLLPEDRSWGVVLDGPGGMGKTSLALEAAHRAPAEHFPLKLWITAKTRELLPEGEQTLQDHRVESFPALLNEIGLALGREDIPKTVPEERPRIVRHALASYRALLVFDNLETFTASERRAVFELLDNLPTGCRTIVTSRRTEGSIAGHKLRLDKLERYAADELLAELGRRSTAVARLTADERERLYEETGGNPLLLTWTVGQLGRTTGRCRTVDEALARLMEAHRREALDEKNDPLGFVFGDLVESFTAGELAVLAALVHFTQPAPVEWLLPLARLSRTAAETALDGLRDRALLIEDDSAGTWLLPPLAAQFLRRSRPEAVAVTAERLADRAYAMAVENGYENHSRFGVLEAGWPQLAAALRALIAGDNRRLQAYCNAIKTFLEFSGRWDEGISLTVAAESRALGQRDSWNAGRRAYDLGYWHYLRGQAAEVLACADRAEAHWRETGSPAGERAAALQLRGIAHRLLKDHTASIAALREALALERSSSP